MSDVRSIGFWKPSLLGSSYWTVGLLALVFATVWPIPAESEETDLASEKALPDVAALPPQPDGLSALKGGSVLGSASPWPHRPPVKLAPDLSSLPPQRCDPPLIAHSMKIGKKDHVAKLGGLAQGLALGAASKALGSLTGGAVKLGGKDKAKPELYKDPIRKKHKLKIEHPERKLRLRVGGQAYEDGLLFSTRLDKAEDKGTFHAVYLERENCERIWPHAYWAYELWGKWKLTVSWTRTTETYQDGNLIDRDFDSGGFSTEWTELLASDSGMIDLNPGSQHHLNRYQRLVSEELGDPVWRQLGFGAPTSGVRSLGTPFKLTPEQIAAFNRGEMRLVVHVTRDADGLFQTVSLPMRVSPGDKNRLSVARLAAAFE